MEKNKPNSGFTLLEVIIAMAIMTMAFGAILAIESNALNDSARAKQMNVVAMLVKDKMIQTEYEIEGKTFDELDKEKSAQFEAPYEDYKWKRVIKEVTFPSMNPGNTDPNDTSVDESADMLAKIVSKFLSDSMREVDVSVIWKKNGKDQTFTIATYWVDLNHAFNLQE